MFKLTQTIEREKERKYDLSKIELNVRFTFIILLIYLVLVLNFKYNLIIAEFFDFYLMIINVNYTFLTDFSSKKTQILKTFIKKISSKISIKKS